jgi:hypothetical protein
MIMTTSSEMRTRNEERKQRTWKETESDKRRDVGD